MNTVHAGPHHPLHLVEIIDFKWLMAGDGHRVHVERLQTDPAYAGACLALGAASHRPALRDAAQRLSATLNLPLPDPRAAA
ncbi:hypothetical protein [Pseudaquabacterium pictum]|uniref:hypothetical protein n=1 Tax=Pseudaquabacterium pictum TaxID=2315236 RepID=UPI0010FA3ADC|nr:hypothetical protein [Rubrivivax pictus]